MLTLTDIVLQNVEIGPRFDLASPHDLFEHPIRAFVGHVSRRFLVSIHRRPPPMASPAPARIAISFVESP